MPKPSTCTEFLDLVRASGLIEQQRLTAWLRNRAADSSSEPRALAGALVGGGLLTGFQASRLLLGTARGFTLGKYTLLERLGAGGMGTVFLAAHPALRRRVALKVLPPDRAGGAEAMGRFCREARASAALDHPNIVRIHDLDCEGDLHFLVMEYVDGRSLQELVERFGPLDVVRAAHYIRQAARGLQHVHRAGLVHRDVKPANLLLDRRGTVKVLDLGLARFAQDQGDELTRKLGGRHALGTADYLAPEQAIDSHDVDTRVDVYGLGATFYFLLTGRPPFAGKTVAQKLLGHQMQVPPCVRKLRPEVPAGLAEIVERMMAKDRDRRYPVPAAVSEALAPWTAAPVPPPSESEMPRLSPAAQRADSTDALALQRAGSPTALGVGDTEVGSSRGRPPAAPVATPAGPGAVAPSMRQIFCFDTEEEPDATRPRRSRRRAGFWAAAGAFALVALGIGVGVGFRRATPEQPPPSASGPEAPPPRAPERIVVAEAGGPGTFRTIREALWHARPGDRIVVQDPVHVEALTVNGSLGEDIVIEGDGGPNRTVIWRAPAGQPDEPLLRLQGAGRLRVRGFILEGGKPTRDLVSIEGRCPGLTLEDVQLRGFARSAVRLAGAAGGSDRPLSLVRLRTLAAGENQTALLFEASVAGPSQHVLVQDCRFEGAGRSAVQLAGPVAELRVEGNRVFRAGDGVLYRKAQPPNRVGLMLRNNTFCDVKAGVHFEVSPPAGLGQVVVHNNLFLRAGKPAQVDDAARKPNGGKGLWDWKGNVRDDASGESAPLFLGAAVKQFKLPVDPADDSRFLRYPKGSPLAQAGFDQTPVGAPPIQK